MIHVSRRLALSVLVAALPAATLAQGAWPNRTIRLISPFPPGSVTDIFNRLMAERLSVRLSTPVVIDVKAGGSTMIAMDALAKAAPDGYTLAITSMASTVNNRALFEKMPYDPIRDFTPVSQVAAVQLLLVAPGNATYNDLKGFLQYAKAVQRPINYGSWGSGSGAHVAGFVLARETGLVLNHVAYKGEGQPLIDLKGGQLDITWASLSGVTPYLASGAVKLLAITGAERFKGLPQVPTFKELGVPGLDLPIWAAAYLPANTPKPIVEVLQREIAAILREPEVMAKIRSLGWEPWGNSSEEFVRNYNADYPRWRDLMRAAGVKPE